MNTLSRSFFNWSRSCAAFSNSRFAAAARMSRCSSRMRARIASGVLFWGSFEKRYYEGQHVVAESFGTGALFGVLGVFNALMSVVLRFLFSADVSDKTTNQLKETAPLDV